MSKARVSQTTVPSNRKKVLSKPKRNKSSSSLAPRGEPWNHKQFLKRVETFNSLKWHIKRIDVHPLLCARFGWKCIAKNTLQCSECGTKINYKTNPLWNIDTNNKVAAAFIHNISFAHNPQCIFHKNPCHKSFEYLPRESNVMKQEWIENMTSWIQTDTHSFYLIPKLNPTSKQHMIHCMNDTLKDTEHVWYIDIMLLSASGWKLNCFVNDNNKYIACRYCNKCISFQCYDYHKVVSLFPEDDDKDKRQHMDIGDNLSNILNQELPIHDTESVIHRLSALGLKIDCNVRRSHSFQIYETQSLQKQAHFNNNDTTDDSKCSSHTLSMASSPSFGVVRNVIQRPFGCNMSLNSNYNMSWPKQSILTQSNSSAQSQKKKMRKKRSRQQMSEEHEEEDMSLGLNEEYPRKKMKVYASNCVEYKENMNDNNDNKKRRNRKRKTMDDLEETVCTEFDGPHLKKRRTDARGLMQSKKRKRGKKRKYEDVFENEEIKDNDEDDDIKNNEMRMDSSDNRPKKRARMDTTTSTIVNEKKTYFDLIDLHNDHCPFKMKHKYDEDAVYGWNYCLRLVPHDVMYIKQIVAESNKRNVSKSRF